MVQETRRGSWKSAIRSPTSSQVAEPMWIRTQSQLGRTPSFVRDRREGSGWVAQYPVRTSAARAINVPSETRRTTTSIPKERRARVHRRVLRRIFAVLAGPTGCRRGTQSHGRDGSHAATFDRPAAGVKRSNHQLCMGMSGANESRVTPFTVGRQRVRASCRRP